MSDRTQPLSAEAVADRTDDLSGASSARTLPARADNSAGNGNGSEDEALVGRILAGRYQLESVLGRGGMGVVYTARHIAINRTIAVKVLRRDLARSGDAVARFHREARAAASIGSPYIVDVFDFGFTDEGDAYIAMERLDGIDLRRLVKDNGALAPSRALQICRQIAKGLSAAHARGIVHRDLKSENVFVCPREGGEHIKLLDFGISKVTELDDGRGPLTSEGVVMGTPHYMAPELLHGAMAADQRADIYALGCVLYEMLTNTVPFSGRTAMEVAYKHVHEPVEPPSSRRAGLAPALDKLVLHALAKNPDERIRDADAFLSEMDALERAPSSTLPPPVTESKPAPPSRRSSSLLVAGAALSIVFGTILALRRPDPAAAPTDAHNRAPVALADSSTTLPSLALEPDATAQNTVDPSLSNGALAEREGSSDASSALDHSEDSASPDASLSRASERTPAGNSASVRSSTALDASVVHAVDTGVPIAPLLPDVTPRSPDDGLKQTPYGARFAR
ncbi:MAG: protein kinase [Polyangiales bacterium]